MPTKKAQEQARKELVKKASNVFTGELVDLLKNIRKDKEQTIDHEALDNVIRSEWAGDMEENAKTLVTDFESYLEENKDEIESLTIFYDTPHRRQNVTLKMIKDVLKRIKNDKPKLAPLRVWQAYSHLDEYKGERPVSELTAIIALIRRACGIDKTVSRHSETVRRNFQNWIMKHHSGGDQKFNKEQMEWLHMIRDHITNSFHIERDDLESNPFDTKGGMAKMYKLFGDDMDKLIQELNAELVA